MERNLTNLVRRSIRVNNTIPATGGKESETNDEIRNNTLAFFAAQNRAVTQRDYEVRTFAMPSKYGSVAKVYAVTDTQLDISNIQAQPQAIQTSSMAPGPVNVVNPDKNNPFAINLYILSYDSNQNLVVSNQAVKTNLKNYLNQYRMLTDSVNILDGYIINVGVDFSIIVYKNYNKR